MTPGIAVPLDDIKAAKRLGIAATVALLLLVLILAKLDHWSSRTVALRSSGSCARNSYCAVLVADATERELTTIVRQRAIPVTGRYLRTACVFDVADARVIERLRSRTSPSSHVVLQVRLGAEGKRCVELLQPERTAVWKVWARESYLSIVVAAFLRH